MNNSFWRLGARSLWRDLRSGELRLLIVAVTLAVAALTAVGFFADRLKSGLQRDAHQLLGGDAAISSNNPTPATFAAKARALGLDVVQSVSFPTMARASDDKGSGAKLVVTGAASVPGGVLTVVVPAPVPRGITQLADFTGATWVGGQPTIVLKDAQGNVLNDTIVLRNGRLYINTIRGTTVIIR